MRALALLAALVPAWVAGPALAAEEPARDPEYPPMKREISETTFYVLGGVAAAGAAWLAYDAGDDADESQRNLLTIGAAYAVWGAVIYYNSQRAPRRFALVPTDQGALLHTEFRFGGPDSGAVPKQ